VIFEAPHRVGEALADMADVLGDRAAVIARELTKLHEDVARGTLRTLAEANAGQALKGEIVIVVGAAEPQDVSDEAIGARLAEMLDTMSLKDAAKAIAEELQIPAGLLKKAINVAHKGNYADVESELADLEKILIAVGRK